MKLEDTTAEQESEDDDMERCAPAEGGGPAEGEEERHDNIEKNVSGGTALLSG